MNKMPDPNSRKPRGLLRAFRWLIAAALLFAIALFAWLFFSVWSPLENEYARIRADGYPVTGSELNDFYTVPDHMPDTTEIWLDAISAVNSAGNKGMHLQIIGGVEAPIPPPGESWELLDATEKFLVEQSEAMQLIAKAGAAGGAVRFPVDFRQGINTLLTDTQNARQCARFLMLDAHVAAHRGDYKRAHQDICNMLAISDALQTEPTLVSQLVRIALYNMATRMAGDLLPYSDWDDAQLLDLQQRFGRADFRQNIHHAMVGERCFFLSMMMSNFPPAIRGVNARKGLEFYRELIASPDESWKASLQKADQFEADIKTLRNGMVSRYAYVGVLLTLPAVERCYVAGGNATTIQRCMATALAIRRHELKNGMLPDNLESLVPNFLPTIPIDPFDEKPLKLKTGEDGIRIYSVAENGTDEGGQFKRDRTQNEPDLGLIYGKRPWPPVDEE